MKKMLFMCIALSVIILTACSDDQTVNVSKPETQVGQTITTDTLKGAVKGTLISGKTYYFATDITVNFGDTLLMQSGTRLIALPGATLTATSTPQITMNGTFISLGTKDKPNYITVLPALQGADNAHKGYWGGIQCGATSGDLIIKWTHIEYIGGPAGANADPYTAGDARYGILFQNQDGNFIMEDSWMYGSKDDCVRTIGGKISIMRNTFESTGEIGGESFNMKSGTVGDVAYNLFIGSATNGPKTSNSGGKTNQCNVNIYNNTILNCGFRQVKTGRSGALNVEQGAKGKIFNNIVVNCKFAFRIVKDADTLNTFYGNTFYYGSDSSIVDQFLATLSGSVSTFQPSDVYSLTPGANDPQFVSYDVNQFTVAQYKAGTAQPETMKRVMSGYNFHLKPASPAVGKGKTDFTPVGAVTRIGGDFGTTITPPGKDLGAYQANGTGNQH